MIKKNGFNALEITIIMMLLIAFFVLGAVLYGKWKYPSATMRVILIIGVGAGVLEFISSFVLSFFIWLPIRLLRGKVKTLDLITVFLWTATVCCIILTFTSIVLLAAY